MRTRYLIGVDVGTTSTKAVLVAEDGRILGEAVAPSRLIQPAPDHVEQDPEDIFRSVVETVASSVRQAGVSPSDVAGIALDGQMAGIMLIDDQWNPVTPYDSWLDTRCSRYVHEMRAEAARVSELSGGPPTYSHGPKLLWWLREHPEAFGRASKVVMPAGWVAGRLAGLRTADAFIDVTYVHFSCLADARRKTWSQELCDRFGIPMEKLPRIVEPWETIGYLTPAMAQQTGLREGVPIVAGAGDQAAAMVGAGVVRPGMVYDAAGTASVLAACTAEFVPDARRLALLTARMVPAGLWYAIGYINGGGLNLRWFRDLVQKAGGGGSDHLVDYARLDEMAARVSHGCDGLVFVPHLGGRVCPNQPDIRGAWVGLTWSHGLGHLYRSILESVAFEYALYLSIERELIPTATFTEVRVVGGGSRSALWNQIKADVLGIPYVQLNVTEAGALGAATLAGYGVGIFRDWGDAVQRFVRPVRRFEPYPAATAHYHEAVQYYRSLLEDQDSLWRGLAVAREGRPGFESRAGAA